jgi:ABC-type antimicrobial peptide transport system permease subunit
MATAHAANRGKEVGVRKVSGAIRSGLVLQFIAESVIISFISTIVALFLVHLLLPFFNTLVSKDISVPYGNPLFLALLLLIVLFTGLLAGSYPAFFLSAFRPALVLKGNTTPAFSGASLRKTLVISQFTVTVLLIASAFVIRDQVNFIRTKNLGYDRSSVLHFTARGVLKNFETFRNKALENSAIKYVSLADNILVQINNQNNSVKWPGKAEGNQQLFRTVVVGYDFIETMGIKIKEGRSFSKEFNDTTSFILTQKAVDVMGLTNPVGTRISQWGDEGIVVGVIDDIHSRTLQEAIDPVVIMCTRDYISEVHVRFEAGKTQEAIAHLEKLYHEYNPEFPFEYAFLDDSFDKMYQNEKVSGSLAISFTFIAIIISGLGLLGLAAYTAEKKKKEISIRKILGASVPGIVSMISKDFLKLSFIATIIGCAIAYFLMEKFLSGYVYHTELRLGNFVITAVLTTLITMVTIIVQVTRASLSNPVEALRSE